MRLLDVDVPAGHVEQGEKRRVVMPRRYQLEWLRQMNAPGNCMWLEADEVKIQGSSERFFQHVSCMLHQCGTLANLSLRENILLPFLYTGRDVDGNGGLARAEAELTEVAARLDISGKLDEQAGERSTYMHALIALGRAMLIRPDFLVVQDAHSGIQPHRQEKFHRFFCEAVEQLGVGVLYLSASDQDSYGLEFCQSLAFAVAEETL